MRITLLRLPASGEILTAHQSNSTVCIRNVESRSSEFIYSLSRVAASVPGAVVKTRDKKSPLRLLRCEVSEDDPVAVLQQLVGKVQHVVGATDFGSTEDLCVLLVLSDMIKDVGRYSYYFNLFVYEEAKE